MCLLENDNRLWRQLNLPLTGRYIQDSKGPSSAKPAFAHFIEVPETMNNVSLSVLFREVEQVNGTGGMSHVYCNIADLLEPVGTLVYPEQL